MGPGFCAGGFHCRCTVAVADRIDRQIAGWWALFWRAALITATGHSFSSFPRVIINAGQLLIGVSLGALHNRVLSLRPALSVCRRGISLLYMLLAAAFSVLLAYGSGLPWPTAAIATTPGGIGEMALTAQALQLGVPVVTAFHTIRLLALLLTAGAMYRYWQKWRGARAAR